MLLEKELLSLFLAQVHLFPKIARKEAQPMVRSNVIGMSPDLWILLHDWIKVERRKWQNKLGFGDLLAYHPSRWGLGIGERKDWLNEDDRD